ncbi:MAG TPA: preprotein translocase subunit SecY [Phycisphaerales bacterium]|nr:preprotein translocase subunit SecY [Phycisphaerales bacterium]
MFQAVVNIFKIPELRNRVFFTLFMIVVYRIGFWIPLIGVDQSRLKEHAQQAAEASTGFGSILDYTSTFSGGSFSQSTIFGLGIMPYITASIIFQILQTVMPGLQDLKKEGASGQQKVTEWTRYTTVFMCIIQGLMWLSYMRSTNLIEQHFLQPGSIVIFYLAGIVGLTAGSVFLMWMGEQIDKYGIGNGISIILTAGIVSRMPHAIQWVVSNTDISTQASAVKPLGLTGVLFLVAAFVFVVAGAIVITVAQRRIPIQQAKHTRGRKQVGGMRHYLPLRVNHAGVMPIVFASTLLVFPAAILGYLAGWAGNSDSWWAYTISFMKTNFTMGEFPYVLAEIALIYFFSYFWTTIVFSPEDMAKQLRDAGSFIPGLRPGPRTAEYLQRVIGRVTFVGAGFLAVIAVIPSIVAHQMDIPFFVSSFLGGTSLLIVVSVALDVMQRIEANLLMRNYAGFLGAGEQGRPAPRLRNPRR